MRTDTAGFNRLFSNPVVLTVWAMTAAFGSYFCVYGLRKPFTAAAFADITFLGIGAKTVFVTSQVMGYTVSKFLGISIVSSLRPERRASALLLLVMISELALILFGVSPPSLKLIWLFVNGLPLGMAFGLILRYLEGRVMSETLTAGLCASFILADGVAKSAGSRLIELGISQYWMPGVAGGLFLIPFALFVWMLSRLPPPDAQDLDHRSERPSMTYHDRKELFFRYAPGLSMLILVYLLLTILRSVRADFAVEIWSALGFKLVPSVFTTSELWVASGVLVANGSVVIIRKNRSAFFTALGISLFGFLLLGFAVVGLLNDLLGGFSFMVLTGLGLYLPYVAIHTTIFERLLALTREKGNLGFLLYLADAVGYLGYVVVMLIRPIFHSPASFNDFFIPLTAGVAVAASALLINGWAYFARKTARMGLYVMEPVNE